MQQVDARRTAATLRRLGGSLSLYLVALLVPRLVRFAAIPIVVRAVAPDVYGSFVTLWIVIPVSCTLCDLGLGTAALRFAPESSASERRSLFGTLVTTRAALGVFIALLLVAFGAPLARALTGREGDASALRLLALTIPLTTVTDALWHELRSREAHRSVSLLTIARTLISNGVTVLFVAVFAWGLSGFALARPIAELLVLAMALALSAKLVAGRPGLHELRRLLVFGAPIGLFYLFTTLRDVDRWLIRLLTSVEQVAAYDVATRVVAPLALSNVALALVLEPHLYKHASAPNTPAFVATFARGYVALFASGAMLLALASPEIFALLAPSSYWSGILAVPALVFTSVADGLLRIAGVGPELSKNTRAWLISALANLALSLPLTWLLVPRLGVAGAGFALLAGNTLATVVINYVASNLSNIRLPIVRALAVIWSGALGSTALLWGAPRLIAMRAAAAAAFALFAWYLTGLRFQTLRSELGVDP